MPRGHGSLPAVAVAWVTRGERERMFTSALMILQVGGPSAGPGIFRFFLQAGPMAKGDPRPRWRCSRSAPGRSCSASWCSSAAPRAQREVPRSVPPQPALQRGQRQAGKLGASPLVGIFQAGYAEIDSQIKSAPDPERPGEKRAYRITSLPALERTLTRAVESRAPAGHRLARPSSPPPPRPAPFIGLFGTVWGIMQAFNDIGIRARPRSWRWRRASPRR